MGAEERRHPVGVECRAERLEGGQGPAGVVDGDVGMAGGQHPADLEADARRLEGEVEARPPLERGLQVRDGRLRVAPGDGHPAAGAGHDGSQPVAVHGGDDVGQPLDGSGGRIPVTRGDVGVDEEVEGAGEV